ncbi:hypothetical protein [Ignatzschineria cameli]|nr:hypothetical protein [Ignatzschineria cameli]
MRERSAFEGIAAMISSKGGRDGYSLTRSELILQSEYLRALL